MIAEYGKYASYISDVQPRTIMCPLPEGYSWEVIFYTGPGEDCVHIKIHKKTLFSAKGVKSCCAVTGYAKQSDDWIVQEIINRSYREWNEYVTQGDPAIKAKVERISDRLSAGTTPVRVTVK